MKNWWKNPVLHGEDNDYGQHDYLIEELPHGEERQDILTSMNYDEAKAFEPYRKALEKRMIS